MFKSVLKTVLIIVLVLCLSACKNDETYKVIVASDLHFISDRICDNGPFFQSVLDLADGKIGLYDNEVVDEFINEVIEKHPDVLLLTGDFAFNAEKESHEDLAEKFKAVEEAGIPVLVLPGNHDVYMKQSAKFEGDSYEMIETASSYDFRTIYYQFGFEDCIAEDETSLSYVYQVNDSNRIMVLDANYAGNDCAITNETLKFVEQELEKAKNDKCNVIVACHQNLFKHSNFDFGYVLINNGKLLDLLNKYGVTLFLSGHMHTQHYIEEKGVTEICTSSLSMYPLQYGELETNGRSFSYQTCSLDMDKYAKEHNVTDPNFGDLIEYAGQRMDFTNGLKFIKSHGDNYDNLDEMIDFIGVMNRAWFSGNFTSVEQYVDEHEEWIKQNPDVEPYINRVAKEFGNDYRSIKK